MPSFCSRRVALSALAISLAAFHAHRASADVLLAKADGWEAHANGRVGAFFSYAFGDSNPIARPGENIPLGAGLNTGFEGSPGGMDAAGNLRQGTFTSMRVRSGFVPNVLGFSLRRALSEQSSLELYTSIWATIETESLRKTTPPITYLQEGYGRLQGPWGSLVAGRSLDLYSRGATETDFLYGHGYALGFGGQIDNYGPANGLIGFGVIASFFAPGIVYATPTVGGLQLTAGVYDPAPLPGGYEATRSARPEAELTYDAEPVTGFMKVHLFANGEYQKVYKQSSDDSAESLGVGYGGRLELGAFHLGASGHYGKGLGLHYALESSAVSVSQNFELRTFDGYSVLAQYVLGAFDLNAGWGISRVFLLDSDKADPAVSVPKYEQAFYGAVVYHLTPSYHFDVDYLRAQAKWRFGEKQTVNFVNAGVTATW
jgi:hypothetical protein